MRKILATFLEDHLSRLSNYVLAFVLTAVLAGTSHAYELVDRVVGVVNGDIITLFEVNDELSKLLLKTQGVKPDVTDPQFDPLRRQLLDNMVNDHLLRQEAARVNLTISDTEVQQMINDIKKKNNMNEQQFNAQLAKEGLTRKEFEENLRLDSLRKQIIGYMVNRKIIVTDEEIAAFNASNNGQIPLTPSLSGKTPGNIGLIMVPTMKDAENIRKMIQGKQLTFEEAAKKFSQGPGREQGGFLGDITMKDLAPALREAISSVPRGEVAAPVMLDGKAVLLIDRPKGDAPKAQEPQPAQPAAASGDISPELKNQIYEVLYKQKFDKLFQEYMEKLRDKSVVEIRL